MLIVFPYIYGEMRFPSICCEITTMIMTQITIDGDTVNATMTHGIAPSSEPKYGMKLNKAPTIASIRGYGSPMIQKPRKLIMARTIALIIRPAINPLSMLSIWRNTSFPSLRYRPGIRRKTEGFTFESSLSM
ncbi:hypothetical protein D3C81_1858800 [compost metagenome]